MEKSTKEYTTHIVTNNNYQHCLDLLRGITYSALDTETYGAKWNDKMFALQIAVQDSVFYFNFHDYSMNSRIDSIRHDVPIVDMSIALEAMDILRMHKSCFMHNAKFDMHRLHYEELPIPKTIDTMQLARLKYNQHMKYNLDSCLKRELGLTKNDKVAEYIKEHRLWEWESIEGKARRNKLKFFDQVPFDIMVEYGCDDAWQTLQLGKKLMKDLEGKEDLIEMESKVLHATQRMEVAGIKVNQETVTKGWQYEQRNKERLEQELTRLGGSQFRNGPKWLSEIFDREGVAYQRKPKTGNPIFDKRAMASIDHPIAKKVVDWRRADKYIGTYYASFREVADEEQIIHANIRVAGTDTGRFSYADPNLQNVPKEEEGDYEVRVRSCFIPRSNEYELVAIDYAQQEFRLMLDYAGETKLIQEVMAGKDLHQATADMVGITRKQAKMLNFGLLYGMGPETLAITLGISLRKAHELRDKYFFRLPRVEAFIDGVISKARRAKKIRTWTGRELHFPNKDFAYAAPNHLIQGGSADMVKQALVKCDRILTGMRSKLLVQVHDELLFEIHKNERSIIPKLRDAMKEIYTPFNGMYMDCSVEVGNTWGQESMREIKV